MGMEIASTILYKQSSHVQDLHNSLKASDETFRVIHNLCLLRQEEALNLLAKHSIHKVLLRIIEVFANDMPSKNVIITPNDAVFSD